jgi:hypothetical protein
MADDEKKKQSELLKRTRAGKYTALRWYAMLTRDSQPASPQRLRREAAYVSGLRDENAREGCA